MTDGRPQPAIDALLDEYIAAWHAGDGPSSAAFVARAAEPDRDELEQLIAAYLQLAPSVEPTAARATELAADPTVARIVALESDRWDASAAIGALPDEQAHRSWGSTLQTLREQAELSIGALAAAFAERFALGASDAGRTATALQALERGSAKPAGVAARAARALEQLLDAPAGVLVSGAAPALADPRLRGALPEAESDRAQFTDLLRAVDDELTRSGAPDETGETLQGLLGIDGLDAGQ